jgi:nucleotide-binding universal stress UspA family protein
LQAGSGKPRDDQAHLIVPLDGSETVAQALPVTAGLAKGLSADVILVRVVPRSQFGEQYIDQSELANRYCEAVTLDLSREGIVDVNDRRLMGEVAPVILDMTREIGDCLVVMTHKGSSAGLRWVLGSVADKVIRSSAKPTLLVHIASDS